MAMDPSNLSAKRSAQWLKALGGVLVCGSAALMIAEIAALRPWSVFVPLAFIPIIVLLSLVFGYQVSIFGSLISALIFAHFMFAPLGHIRIANLTERAMIGWMLLGGIAVPYLLSPDLLKGRRS
jgi:K+-sensing histidine kinase KdpD